MSAPVIRDLYFSSSGSLVVSLDPTVEMATDVARSVSAVCERWTVPQAGSGDTFVLVGRYPMSSPIDPNAEAFGHRFLADLSARLAVSTGVDETTSSVVVTDLATDMPIFEASGAQLDELFQSGAIVGTVSDDDRLFQSTLIDHLTESGLMCGVLPQPRHSIAV